MTSKRVRVIARDEQSTTVAFESSCDSCSSCAHGRMRISTFDIPGEFEHEVELDLALKHQIFALFNSWLLPLMLALVFAFVADYLPLGEIYGIILAVCGFSLGVMLCRQLNSAAVATREVHRG